MLDLKNGTNQANEEVITARQKLATEVAGVLSAMYGTTVTACTDKAKAGCVSMNGADLNVSTGITGTVGFSDKTAIEWKNIDLVSFGVDCEGNATVSQETLDWATKAGFPVYSYDGDTVAASD